MSLGEVEQRCGRQWPAIARARAATQHQRAILRGLLKQEEEARGGIDSGDLSVVVFGSLAREEWTAGSDLDWTLLIDGQADHEHATTAQRMAAVLEQSQFKPPGPAGVFGSLTFSHNIIHQIGGADDSNRNTTQRLLLLLESHPVQRREAYARVVTGILRRYLQNDFRPFRLKVPRFLLNDLHRFWRTMCVDYASKYRERAAKEWAVRNVKLRMSRKLIFAAGMIACYSCDPRLVRQRDPGLAQQPTVEGLVRYLATFADKPPLDIISQALLRSSTPGTASDLLSAYDEFLARLDNQQSRDHLGQLTPEAAAGDHLFQELQTLTQRFQEALARLFVSDDAVLAAIHAEYGVF